jgi:hypothetical protein
LADVTAQGERADTAADAAAPGRPMASARAAQRLMDLLTSAKSLLIAHLPFCIVVAAATAMRVIVMLGYRPILWFNDSYNYVDDAVRKVADPARQGGYPLFLYVLMPFHSVALIAALQALMGLVMGVAIYAVLRHRGLPWWGATLPALPVLFDVYEMQLEHMITTDILLIFLVTVCLVVLCWQDRPPVWLAIAIGLLIGYAGIVRSVGEPLLVVFAVGMLLRGMGWRRAIAMAVAAVAPMAGYMIWFHSQNGQYAITEGGAFLYSRVQSFAECAKMNPPADLRVLCDPRPPQDRPNSQEYLWDTGTPLSQLTGPNTANRFTPSISSLTSRFAERAILAQPIDYLRVVVHDTLHTFAWTREPTGSSGNNNGNVTGSGPLFQFGPTVADIPWWAKNDPGDAAARQIHQSLLTYAGPSLGQPKIVQPYAGFIQDYEKYVWLRGTLLGVIVLIGAAGVVTHWRRWGGLTLLPWGVAVLLIVLPPMTAGFSYRYAMAAVPAACLAAGLAFTRDRPGKRVSDWLREHGLLGSAPQQPAAPQPAAQGDA